MTSGPAPVGPEPVTVPAFDQLEPAAAADLLRPVCASTRWLHGMVDARPFGDRAALSETAGRLLAALTWADLDEALAAHPRIGERATGSSAEATFSRAEQSGARDDVAEPLRTANVAYEERFGWVFLICATGLTGGQMLAELRRRMDNNPSEERAQLRTELAKIVQLRLAKVFS